MDVIITAFGEFIWASSCAVVNFCLCSGISALVVFVSFLCAILASAFYQYTTKRPQMSLDEATMPPAVTLVDNNNDDDDGKSLTSPPTTITTTTTDSDKIDDIDSLSEIEIRIEENTIENVEEEKIDENVHEEEVINDILIDTIEGTEEDIQKQQIQNIYRLLNEQHLTDNWTAGDFLEQLKMYGLHSGDDEELELL